MKWVRDNTTQGSIFIHWWDYGYWIQTLGERPTVTDGGHAGGDNTDHYIGRYILTTPNPDTALSYMKTENVSYLLIDSTDLGKYSAYSKIGGNNDFDRFSYIPTGTKDPSQTRETSNQTVNVYKISMGVDEDIIYTQSDGSKVFLPGPTYGADGTPNYKSYLGGIIFGVNNTGSNFAPQQPKAVYFYQGNQITIPLKYLYVQNQLIDFGTGLDSVFFVYPQVLSDSQGLTIDSVGAGIYLSPKVSKSLFAQLYLMNDPNNEYPTLSVAHSEQDMVVSSLSSQGANIGEFVYYNGFRGPIKIWKADYPAGTPTYNEFLESNWSFGGLDYLFN
jgi:hypothetical protein